MDPELMKIVIAAGAAVMCTIALLWVVYYQNKVMLPKLLDDAAKEREAARTQQKEDRDTFLSQQTSTADKFLAALAGQLAIFRQDLGQEREARTALATKLETAMAETSKGMIRIAEGCRTNNPDGRPLRPGQG